ncbi:hypothetical protein BGZ93_002583 [Podila epicladia]|nr:hypothetical protein BGZ92_004626 [Podila epicladia]KAG0082032.1 hypothetical protein BGZ93_002583 [Podila epicladia]
MSSPNLVHHLRKTRVAVMTLALVAGMMYAVCFRTMFYIPLQVRVLTVAFPYVVAAVYANALWSITKKRLIVVPIYLRAFLVLGLAIGWLYLDLMPLTTSGIYCALDDRICHMNIGGEVIGTVAALLMVAEVAMTLKVGPVDMSESKEHGGGGGGVVDGSAAIHGVPGQPAQFGYQQQHPQHAALILLAEQQYQQHMHQQHPQHAAPILLTEQQYQQHMHQQHMHQQ